MLNPYLQRGYQGLGLLSQGLGLPGPNAQGFTLPNTSIPSQFSGGQGVAFGGNPGRLSMLLGNGDTGDGNQFSAMGGGVPSLRGLNPASLSAQGAMVPRFNGGINSVGGPNGPLSGGTFNFGGQPGGFGTNIVSGVGDTGGMTSASTMPGMVPRIDGGAGPNGQPAGGVDASGNPNIGFGSLLQSYPGGPFVAPTGVTEQNDPGYQFRLQQGQQALQNSAAARGGLLSGGTAKALADYNQNAASGEYGNVYNRALNTYGTNYNQFVNDQTNRYNKLAAISGIGQTTANDLSLAGLNTGNSVANTLLTSGGQIGQQLNNAGAATASGYVGGANAITGAIGGVANNLSALALLSGMNKQGSPGYQGSFDPFAGIG